MSEPTAVPGYVLGQKLGSGLGGTVYRARRKSDGRGVAIKFPDPADPEMVVRFVREARFLAEFPHAALVEVLEMSVDTGPLYLVMPHLVGGDLSQRLIRGPELTVEQAHDVIVRVADALEHLHEQGIIHRDVKPANILLDESGRAFLADLGLGRGETTETLTATNQLMGTPAYMAPELWMGEAATPATDTWSLGVLCCELLTGARPFEDSKSTCEGWENHPRVIASGGRPWIRRCLRTCGEDRPAAGEVARAFQQLGSDSTSPLPSVPGRPRARSILPAVILAGCLGMCLGMSVRFASMLYRHQRGTLLELSGKKPVEASLEGTIGDLKWRLGWAPGTKLGDPDGISLVTRNQSSGLRWELALPQARKGMRVLVDESGILLALPVTGSSWRLLDLSLSGQVRRLVTVEASAEELIELARGNRGYPSP